MGISAPAMSDSLRIPSSVVGVQIYLGFAALWLSQFFGVG